jgi:hypothetical protein
MRTWRSAPGAHSLISLFFRRAGGEMMNFCEALSPEEKLKDLAKL